MNKGMKVMSMVLAMLMLVLTGCSTMNGTNQDLWVSVTPETAKFRVDGGEYTGSQMVSVRRTPHTVTASLAGHNSASRSVGTKMSDLAKVDIFVGLFLFWPCLLGLTHPGARDLKQEVVSLTLTPNAQLYAKPDPYAQYAPQGYAPAQRVRSTDELQRAQYILEQRIQEARSRDDARAQDEWSFQQWKAKQDAAPVGQ